MSDINIAVKNTYDAIAPYFSRTRVIMWPEVMEELKNVKANDSILDIGCGNGRLINGLGDKEVKYVGIDFSEGLIKEAKKLHPGKKFVVGDITDPLIWKPLGMFDEVFCVAVFHHIESWEKQLEIVRQMKAHTKSGGWVFISAWNLWNRKYWKNHLDSWKLKMKNWRFVEVPFQGGNKRFCIALDEKWLRKLGKEAGLKDIRIIETKGNICLVAKA